MANEQQVDKVATAADFANLFEGTPVGKVVLETLIRRFHKGPVFEGGIDGVRKSDFRAGARAVVDHIINQCNRSRGVMDEQEQEP